MDNTSMVDIFLDRNKCLRLSPLSSCKNTIYYFIVYKMGMPHYNLEYSYWKRCSISRHHITAQACCVPLIWAYAKYCYGRCGTPIIASTSFCHLIHYFLCSQSADEIIHSLSHF
jgi:hypothetical protein